MPAFGGLLAPHWRGDARGVIVGLTSYTNKAHIVRALLQAICWQVTLTQLCCLQLQHEADEIRCQHEHSAIVLLQSCIAGSSSLHSAAVGLVV